MIFGGIRAKMSPRFGDGDMTLAWLRLPLHYVIPVCFVALTACGPLQPRDGAPASPPPNLLSIPDAVPRDEPPSRYGNMPEYEINGLRFRTLKSSRGYRATGIASWYGTKFHGKLTSSREPYDMYKMTAAHPTLPLPSYVRVTNLDNGRSVVVRVNDRGPFHPGRIIDLSYAAAARLDMLATGTARVRVEAVDSEAAAMDDGLLFLQVGAFAEQRNAQRLQRKLAQANIDSEIRPARLDDHDTIYRVHVGPFHSRQDAEHWRRQLADLGVAPTHIVME